MKLRQIIELLPVDEAYRLLGGSLLMQGRLQEAEDLLNKSLIINPASSEVHFYMAMLLSRRGDGTGATRHVLQSIRLKPTGSIEQYVLLAKLYDQAGKTNRAVKTLQKATGVFPKNQTAQLHFQLGMLLHKDQNKKAFSHMEMALRLSPELAGDKEFMSWYNQIDGTR